MSRLGLFTVALLTVIPYACKDERGNVESMSSSAPAPPANEALVARAKSFELPTQWVAPPGDPLHHHTAGFAKILCSAVFITGPLFLHFPVMKAALEAGKHVFCEKSLVYTPEEVHALRKLHEDHPDLTIQVGLQRRYSLLYQRTKELISVSLPTV